MVSQLCRSSFFRFLALAFLILSCERTDETTTVFFDRDINYDIVETERIENLSEIHNPNVMRIVGNRLFISEYRGTPSFHILEIGPNGSLEYLRGEGREGQGPGEFTRLQEIINADSLIYLYDGNQFKLAAYDLEGSRLPDNEIQLQTEGLASSMFSLPNQHFVAAGTFFHDRFQVFDQTGSLNERHGELIVFDENFTPRDNAIAWLAHATINPEGEYLYLFAQNADLIEKYAINGEQVKLLQGNDTPVPNMVLQEQDGWPVDDGGIVAYLGADSNSEYIYALYSGNLRSESSERSSGMEVLVGNRIHKFDWELNLVNAYELDHNPYAYTIDDHSGLYTAIVMDDGVEIRYQRLD